MAWVLHAPSGKLGDLVTKVLIFEKSPTSFVMVHKTSREDQSSRFRHDHRQQVRHDRQMPGVIKAALCASGTCHLSSSKQWAVPRSSHYIDVLLGIATSAAPSHDGVSDLQVSLA
jgi:hypothetical protein